MEFELRALLLDFRASPRNLNSDMSAGSTGVISFKEPCCRSTVNRTGG